MPCNKASFPCFLPKINLRAKSLKMYSINVETIRNIGAKYEGVTNVGKRNTGPIVR